LALWLGLVWAAVGDPVLAEELIFWKPPNSSEMIMSEAHWGPPDAPLVFSGGVLHVGGSFASRREFRVDEQAVINTHDDAVLTLEGSVTRAGGSYQGLAKLGAGTLRLAGRNSHDGNTLLLQGGLDVLDGGALGAPYRTLNVNTGTRLRYAPGVVVGHSIQLQAEPSLAGLVPAGSYEAITPSQYADSVQWIVDGGEAVQAGAMSGSAPIVKQGAGLLRLAGPAMAYGGLLTVNQGAVAVDDVFWGPVRVNAGARLQGIGQVGATTIGAGGTLAPGNSVGTLSVLGDLTFEPGSRFEVDVMPSGAGDAVYVSGRAALDGHVAVLAGAGDWQSETRYTVLRAAGGVSGRFASVGTDLAFLSPSLTYDAREVTLALTRNGTGFEDVAETPDKPVAEVVDDPAEVPGLHEQVLDMTAPQAREAFGRLSNSWAGSVQSMLLDDTRFLREAVWENADAALSYRARPENAASGARVPGRDRCGHGGAARPEAVAASCVARDGGRTARAWSQAFYSSSAQDAWQGAPGMARDTGGLVLGLDAPLRGGWRLGGVFGVQSAYASRMTAGDRAHAQTAQIGITLAGDWRGVRFSGGAAHGWHDVNSLRDASMGTRRDTPRSRYLAQSDQVFLEASRPFTLARRGPAPEAEGASLAAQPGGRRESQHGSPIAAAGEGGADDETPATTLTPFARLAWVNLRVPGFDEQGGEAALSVAGARRSVGYSTLGVAFAHAVETAVGAAWLEARVGWRHAVGDWHASTTQHFRAGTSQRRFTSQGLPVARDALALSLAVRAQASRTATLGLAYAGQLARGLQDHGLRLDGAWVF
jgi:outer membrane autotransporter protein